MIIKKLQMENGAKEYEKVMHPPIKLCNYRCMYVRTYLCKYLTQKHTT